ncbi:MAG TPA: hypothetical protein VGY55_11735 [Pirellulales bacterium]|jgi:hypothetical protein|nr:hypothetical protein [Pirellulales bacterium]
MALPRRKSATAKTHKAPQPAPPAFELSAASEMLEQLTETFRDLRLWARETIKPKDPEFPLDDRPEPIIWPDGHSPLGMPLSALTLTEQGQTFYGLFFSSFEDWDSIQAAIESNAKMIRRAALAGSGPMRIGAISERSAHEVALRLLDPFDRLRSAQNHPNARKIACAETLKPGMLPDALIGLVHKNIWPEAYALPERIAEERERWLDQDPGAHPKAKRRGGRKTDALMLTLIEENPDAAGWSQRDWRKGIWDRFQVSRALSTIGDTKVWKEQELLRFDLQAQRAQDRRRRS